MSNTNDVPEPGANAPRLGERTGLPVGQFAGGVHSFQALIRQVLALAAERNWPTIIGCDPTYEAWPLGESQVIGDLNRWVGRGKKWVMLAHRFDVVQSRHPRFVGWRATWSHCIECCSIATSDRETTQGMLWTPEWALELQDSDSFAAISSENPRFRAELLAKLTHLQQRGRPGFPVNVLGL
jgi:hypothetical protein